MKRLVSIMVVLAFCLSAPSVMAYERIPDSVSYNGILPDGTSIYENDLHSLCKKASEKPTVFSCTPPLFPPNVLISYSL